LNTLSSRAAAVVVVLLPEIIALAAVALVGFAQAPDCR
jgi:hypothetical protein